MRIKSITMYVPGAAAGSNPTNCYVEWFSLAGTNLFKDDVKDSVLPSGITVTRPLRFMPTPQSLAGMWFNTNASGNLFNIEGPDGCVIDVAVEYTIGVAQSSVSVLQQATVATAAVGSIYYLALDGPSSNKLTPAVGYPTTH